LRRQRANSRDLLIAARLARLEQKFLLRLARLEKKSLRLLRHGPNVLGRLRR